MIARSGDPFRSGDACLLYDAKDRRYLIELIPGRSFHSHRGALPHDDIIGSLEGSSLETTSGAFLRVLRPRLADYVLKMPRGAAVLYPKDAGALIVWADIGPGMTVLEAGTGSGGLTMILARAVGPTGRIVSVERREDHATLAERRIAGFFGSIPDWVDLRVGDVVDMVEDVAPERIVLDVPEPWEIVPAAAAFLPGGGGFACYVPNVPQVETVRSAMEAAGCFIEVSTFEVMMREWSISGRSVRPAHRMVGHTGFVTVGRKVLSSQ
ncbi:MAG TPA: tRNA (adenine-N1)-methyltransferase [Acidimicrobiia bacterium]|nr:tRNA (adenine-N1)-methyltransferase [Acidimicrobiia bacterium]